MGVTSRIQKVLRATSVICRRSKPEEAKVFVVGSGHEDCVRGQHQYSSAVRIEKSESGMRSRLINSRFL
ncbi:hypothetical protein CDL15_Pgr012232 [Punica granatum]|uniref:Uncharacterized protein n=1 Tax=Punica granatum TaxID=22663 RepID=A0A218XNX7_PUNGR|nr:hypothetical protein CDL15_Pgr012232 [Punica granatum]